MIHCVVLHCAPIAQKKLRCSATTSPTTMRCAEPSQLSETHRRILRFHLVSHLRHRQNLILSLNEEIRDSQNFGCFDKNDMKNFVAKFHSSHHELRLQRVTYEHYFWSNKESRRSTTSHPSFHGMYLPVAVLQASKLCQVPYHINQS